LSPSSSGRAATPNVEFTGLRGFSRRSGGMMGYAPPQAC
jgi:hypothetical protein